MASGWRRALRHLVPRSGLGGRCRLPELPATVMKELLLTWISPEVDGGVACQHCGLEYPRYRTPPVSEWKVLPGKTPLQGSPPGTTCRSSFGRALDAGRRR